VRDPVGRLPGQLGRIGTADEQVPGVQAERDGRARQHPPHVVTGLDHRADVRVQDGLDPAPGGQATKPVQVREQGPPTHLVQLRPAVVAVPAGRGGEHEQPRARRRVPVEHRLDVGHRIAAGHVQYQRSEPADRPQSVPGKQRGRQEAVRAELGRGETHRAHLPQYPVRG
jgi:hypothetical protein